MKTIIDNSVRILRPAGLIFMVMIVLLGCSKSKDTTTPGANEVLIQSFAFSPSTITVSVNTTITWTNKDAAAHTVTSDNGLFDSGNMNTDATYTHQFTTAGTFPYHCTYHSSMLAKVIVQ
jgi:plastocyanin